MNNERLCFPALGGVYRGLSGPSVALMRIVAGVALMTHGWGKIQDPMAMVGFVENIGFHPGWFWSPALAVTEFFGGLLLALGLFTRGAAVGTTIVLLVTVYFHWILKDEGWGGSEKSIIWLTITFYFAVHGGQVFALDRLFKREL
jgi:putative oxidoreductase